MMTFVSKGSSWFPEAQPAGAMAVGKARTGPRSWAFRCVDLPRERWLRPGEIRPLLDACPPDFRKLVEAALYTGCRYGDCAVYGPSISDARAGVLRVPFAKAGKPRSVVLSDEAIAFFAGLADGRPRQALLLTRGSHSSGMRRNSLDWAGGSGRRFSAAPP